MTNRIILSSYRNQGENKRITYSAHLSIAYIGCAPITFNTIDMQLIF